MREELPILFNTQMVTAILAGRKTATRRVVKPQPEEDMKYKHGILVMGGAKKDHGKFGFATREWGGRIKYARPPALVGDILYVRETWTFQCCFDCMNIYEDDSCMLGKVTTIHEDKDTVSEGCYIYRADYPHPERINWHPSIHMPKKAARIWLKVTDVRVERLHDMTLDDFLNEGITVPYEAFNDPDNAYMQAKSLFADIWDSTVDKKRQDLYFDANPWVWVIEFERCEKPEEYGSKK